MSSSSSTKKFKGISSLGSFFNDVTDSIDRLRSPPQGQSGNKDTDEDNDEQLDSPAAADDGGSTSSTSFGTLMRRSSWNKGRISFTNSLKTLVSPNNVDTDTDDGAGPGERPGSRRRAEGKGKGKGRSAVGGSPGAEPVVRGGSSLEEVKAAAAAAAAVAAARPRSRRASPRPRPPPSPASRREQEQAVTPPSPDSPGPRRRRSSSMNSAVSDSSQSDNHRQHPLWPSASSKTKKRQVPGSAAAADDAPGALTVSGASGTHRGRHGRPQSSTGRGTGFSTGTGGGSGNLRDTKRSPRPPLSSGRAGSGFLGGSGNIVAPGGREQECFSPEFVGFAGERRREGSGAGANASNLRGSKSVASAPSSRNGAAMGPLSRLLPVSSDGAGAGASAAGGAEEAKAGAGLDADGSTKKKKTFMEKFGDMLEAAAETAIPAVPNTGGQSIGPKGPQEWEEWDAGPLQEFMFEEARTMADRDRLEDVARTDGEKAQLVALAKSWFVPFLSQADFNRQKAALESAEVGTVDSSGRCVPASSVRSSSSSSASRLFTTRRSPAATASASSSDPGGDAARRASPTREHSGAGGGGVSGSTATAEAAAAGAGGGSVDGIVVGGGAAVREAGGIRRAVVLGYVVDGGGGGRGGTAAAAAVAAAAAPEAQYLVEVDTVPSAGGAEGEGSWACYKRFSDFRGLWAGLSQRHRRLQALPFPPPVEGSGFFLGRFGREVEGERQQQLNTVLEVLLELHPRPQEVVRFLEPHSVGADCAPATKALDAARVAAAKSGAASSRSGCAGGDLSGVLAPSTRRGGRGGAGGVSRGKGLTLGGMAMTSKAEVTARASGEVGRRSGRTELLNDPDGAMATPLPTTVTLKIFLGAVALLQAGAVLQAAGLTRGALAVSAAAAWVSVAGVALCFAAFCGNRGIGGARAGGGGGGRGRENSSGLALSSYSGSSAPTEDTGPSTAAAAAATAARKERETSNATADGGGDGNAGSGWVVRAVMAGEILALILLVFFRGAGVNGAGSNSHWPGFVAASEGSGHGVAGGSDLVAALAAVFGRWLVSAAVVTAALLGSVVLPPIAAALATAHVAGTFAPTPGGTAQSRAGGGRSGPDPDVSAAATVPATEAAEKTPGLRRSTSSSAIAADAQKNPAPGGGGGRSGAASNTRLASPVSSALGVRTGGIGVDDGDRMPPGLSFPGGAEGPLRRRMPAIHPAEATLRLVVAWGGVLGLLGGCWAAVQPLLAFLLRDVGSHVSALLLFPFSRAGGRTLDGSGGPEPAGPGTEDHKNKKKKAKSSQQAATAPKKKKKSNPSVSPLAASGDGTGGISPAGKAAPTVAAPSTMLPPLSAEPKPTVPVLSPVVAADEGAGKAAPGGKSGPASLEQQYEAASKAVGAVASRWKSVVSAKAHRWRVSLAKKIMPATAREEQGAGGGAGGGRKQTATVIAPAAPIFAAPAASFATPRAPPPPPPPVVAPKATPPQPAEEQQQQPKQQQQQQQQDSSETCLEWELIRSLPEGQSSRGSWISAIDGAVASVYASRRHAQGGGGDGGVCRPLQGEHLTPPPPGKNQAPAQRGGRRAVAVVTADDLVALDPSSGGGGGGGGGGGRPAFVSTAEVALLWAVVVVVWATARVEFRLARRRRWGELAMVVVAKAVAAGSVIAGSAPRVWGSGGCPALLLCVMEASRCLAVLALTLAVVRAGIKPATTSGRGARGRASLRRRAKPRPRLQDDPTTPRGEHLAHPVALPLPATAGWVGRTGGGNRRSSASSPPLAAKSEITRRASLTSSQEPAAGGGGGGGGGGWFSSDSWHSNNSGSEEKAAKKRRPLSKHNSNVNSNARTSTTTATTTTSSTTATTTTTTNNNRGSDRSENHDDQAQGATNMSRFLTELSNSLHGSGSSGGVSTGGGGGGRRSSSARNRGMQPEWSGKGSTPRASGRSGRGGATNSTVRPSFGGEVKPEGWVWGDDDAE